MPWLLDSVYLVVLFLLSPWLIYRRSAPAAIAAGCATNCSV